MRSIWILVLAVSVCSCSKSVSVKPALNVGCAPEVLEHDQWAVLTVLHIHGSRIASVRVREAKLAKVALFAKRLEVFDDNKDGSGYSLQVYLVKPLGTNVIHLTSEFFENAQQPLPMPVTLSVGHL